MKKTNTPITHLCLLFFGVLFIISSCKKNTDTIFPSPVLESESAAQKTHTKKYSAEVAQKWLDLQLRILYLSGSNPYSLNGNRQFAYMGVALYEAVVPGMPSYQSLHGQLNAMPQMPTTKNGDDYHWPAAANTALAFLTRNFYPTASAALKTSVDSLESALNAAYAGEAGAPTYLRSTEFGKEVAQRIFNWAQADNSQTIYSGYIASTDPTKWSNTTPNPTGVVAPYWGLNRQFVSGSFNNTASPPPPMYSTDPASEYYKMVKEVYDISQTLTNEQKATALYFRDNPGYQSGTHYQYIFNQVMKDENLTLDAFAVAQAKAGIAMAEAQINCWQQKYTILLDRPTKYIRNVLGHSTWSSFLAMPGHPDYPSGHSQTGGAFAKVMTSLLGENYPITLHTYDNLGMAPRPYNSFFEMADDIGKSRVYGGIHYTYSCTEGNKQGAKIAANILNKLKFKR